MRAKIAGMIVLTTIAALTTSFEPTQDADLKPAAPRMLTAAEADCLVGGKASCLDVAINEAESCLSDAGITASEIDDNLYNMVIGGLCAGSGIWSGISCTWNWLTDLFG